MNTCANVRNQNAHCPDEILSWKLTGLSIQREMIFSPDLYAAYVGTYALRSGEHVRYLQYERRTA
jgi:hypothetical protein